MDLSHIDFTIVKDVGSLGVVVLVAVYLVKTFGKIAASERVADAARSEALNKVLSTHLDSAQEVAKTNRATAELLHATVQEARELLRILNTVRKSPRKPRGR